MDKKIKKDIKQTPGNESSIAQMDEENIVIFHSKSKIEEFFSEIVSFTAYLIVQSQKHYVPAIVCNSPRNV